MLISRKQSIEDILVESLARSPYVEGPDLVRLVQSSRGTTTKQAVYVSLQGLIRSEVVAKVGTKYFLSRVWLQKVNRLFGNRVERELAGDAIFSLREGESISHHFPSLLTCDTYWAHVFSLFIEWMPGDRPIFVWNPHEWMVIGRKQEEANIFKEFEEKDRKAFYTIAGKTPLDMEFKKQWRSAHVAINVGSDITFPSNYYLNVFGDFVVEVFVDERLAGEIDAFYRQNTILDESGIAFFEEMIARKRPVRMRISRKPKKAGVLRKRLAKDFFIPQELSI